MLVYERFVFIHMPKTAGSFLAEALEDELGPPVERRETHDGWDAIPDNARDRPVLMYVRNPWDWYVSWYHFWVRSLLPAMHTYDVACPPLVRMLFGKRLDIDRHGVRGVDDFATVARRACERLTPDDSEVARMIEDQDPTLGAVELGHDFYTGRMRRLAGEGLEDDLLTLGRFELLGEDLERFLVAHGVPCEEGLSARIAARQPVNANPHRPYRDHYDDELRDLVANACGMLVDRFGYSF